MSNSLREQLLKAGLVTKKQAEKAEKEVQKAYRNEQKQHTRKATRKTVKGKSSEQVQRAAQSVTASNKQPKQTNENKPLTPKQYYQQIRKEKEQRDKSLNEAIVHEQKQKGLWAEVGQLVNAHRIDIKADADIAHHFIVDKAVKTLYVEMEQHKKLVAGKLAIAQSEGRYHLIPIVVAKRIRERLNEAIVFFNESKEADDQLDEDDPYKDYQVPDDLIW